MADLVFNSSDIAHQFVDILWDDYKPYIIGAGVYCATSLTFILIMLFTICCCLNR